MDRGARVLTRATDGAGLASPIEAGLRWHERRPPELIARELGDGLAARFGVAFHFPCEHRADDSAPRWSDTQR